MSLKKLLESKGDIYTVLQEAGQETTSLRATVARKLTEFMELLKERHPEAHTAMWPDEHCESVYLSVSANEADLDDQVILTVNVRGTEAEFDTPYINIVCFNEAHIDEALVLTYRSEEMARRLKIEAAPFDEESLDDYYEEEPRTHYR
jgi:hypothetical protein